MSLAGAVGEEELAVETALLERLFTVDGFIEDEIWVARYFVCFTKAAGKVTLTGTHVIVRHSMLTVVSYLGVAFAYAPTSGHDILSFVYRFSLAQHLESLAVSSVYRYNQTL